MSRFLISDTTSTHQPKRVREIMRDAITIIKTNVKDCLTHPSILVRSFARSLLQEHDKKPADPSHPWETIADFYEHSNEKVKQLSEHLFQALVESERSVEQKSGQTIRGTP